MPYVDIWIPIHCPLLQKRKQNPKKSTKIARIPPRDLKVILLVFAIVLSGTKKPLLINHRLGRNKIPRSAEIAYSSQQWKLVNFVYCR